MLGSGEIKVWATGIHTVEAAIVLAEMLIELVLKEDIIFL